MLFNESNELSFTDIFNMLKTDDNLIRKMLESLSCKKYRILLKTGKNKEVSKDDVFSVNSEFKSKLKQLAISAPMIKETFNKEKVDIDRTHAIEAAIVKIMKSRKKMNYIHLLNEVMTILQMFKPTASAIKARIESLIEKDYIERDSEDSNLFRYLA
jgi:cullin 1